MARWHKIAGRCEHCGHWVELAWSTRAHRWVCADCGTHRVAVPEPSSPEAVVEGCTCDPEINHGGREQPHKGWLTMAGCPVHDPTPKGVA